MRGSSDSLAEISRTEPRNGGLGFSFSALETVEGNEGRLNGSDRN